MVLYTVHVGNLSPSIHGDMLRSIFGHFGPIVEIRLVANGGGPSSYGFVDFATEVAAEAALAMSGTEFDGRRLRVERAKSSMTPTGAAAPPSPKAKPVVPTQPAVVPASSHVSAELFIGGLTSTTTSDALRAYFSQFGAVSEASVVTNRTTGASKGYGFCRFQEQRCADLAVARAPHVVDGRVLNVEVSNLARVGGNPPPSSPAPAHSSTVKEEKKDDKKTAVIVEHLMDCGAKVDEYTAKVENDTRLTCANFGSVASVSIPRPIYVPQRVFVEFFDPAAAIAAAESLGSRTYDGRRLVTRTLTNRDCRREASKDAEASSMIGSKRRRDDDSDRHLRADLSHHATQHKFLQKRVEQLEIELEAARGGARQDRDYAQGRIKALTDRCDFLEGQRGGGV